MSSFDWESFLKRWSQETIDAIARDRNDLPPEVLKSGWFGYPGATETQITRGEARLGTVLPPSYHAFLKITNGWRQTSLFSNKLWSIEDIEWFVVRHQAWIDAFGEKSDHPPSHPPSASSNAKAPSPSIADADYFVYGDDQDCSKIRVEYLQTALEISQHGDGAIYLLNPQIVTPDGEWEAWFFGDWLPGADRYRSFQDMMQTEYESFLELRETPVNPVTPITSVSPVLKPEPEAIAATTSVTLAAPEPDESPSRAASRPTIQADWRDLASFTIDCQTRQRQGHTEHRSIIRHQETDTVETRADLDLTAIQRWMLSQLNRRLEQPTAATPGIEITQLRVIRAPQTEPSMVVNQTQPLFSGPIQRGEPFKLEVSMNVSGSALARRLDQPVVCRAQCVARHLSTRLETDLGDITAQLAGGNQSTYIAQFPIARLQQSGLYRLKVGVILQNISASPGHFKVPILLVV